MPTVRGRMEAGGRQLADHIFVHTQETGHVLEVRPS